MVIERDGNAKLKRKIPQNAGFSPFEKTGCLLDRWKADNKIAPKGFVDLQQLLCDTYEVSCRARNERLSLSLS